MASLDDLKKRIASVKSTQKITKAMKMVAAAKLRRAQESAEKGRPYSEKMNNVILNLSNGISDKENAPKLLSGTGQEKTHLCVVMTSDRGLCGGFNSNIIKKAKSYFAKILDEGKELKIITVGSKGNDQLKRVYGDKIIENISFKESKNANYFDADKVGKLVIEKFDYLGQNHFNLIILLVGSIILILLFDKIKIPAALLSGTLVASGILQITDIASYKLPDESINFCLLILGASVGCRFAEKTIKEVAKNTIHSLVATFLLVILGLVAAYIATFFVNNNILTLVLSFCPGGIYEVAVIAIAFDLDPDFVSFHHIIRLLIILFIIPVILKLVDRKKI